MIPKLSVITINLNNAFGLHKTLESIINQTFTDLEYIVIDGASIDGSVEIIKLYADKISYWVSEPDSGIYNAMNKGILMAKGEYLLFLNSGDWLVDKDTLTKVFEIPRIADMIYGHINFISGNETIVQRALNENQLSLDYFFTNSLKHPATFIARKLFYDSMYDESYRIAADKKFFLEKIFLQNCSILQIDEVIANFTGGGISSKPESKALAKKENDRIFAEIIPSRLHKDFLTFKGNYSDIQYLVKIKKYKLLYFAFKGLKKITFVLQKYFSV